MGVVHQNRRARDDGSGAPATGSECVRGGRNRALEAAGHLISPMLLVAAPSLPAPSPAQPRTGAFRGSTPPRQCRYQKYVYGQFLERIGGIVNSGVSAEMLKGRPEVLPNDHGSPPRRATRRTDGDEAHATASLDARRSGGVRDDGHDGPVRGRPHTHGQARPRWARNPAGWAGVAQGQVLHGPGRPGRYGRRGRARGTRLGDHGPPDPSSSTSSAPAIRNTRCGSRRRPTPTTPAWRSSGPEPAAFTWVRFR